MHIFKVYGVSHEFGFLTWLLLPCDGIHVRSSPRSRVHAVVLSPGESESFPSASFTPLRRHFMSLRAGRCSHVSQICWAAPYVVNTQTETSESRFLLTFLHVWKWFLRIDSVSSPYRSGHRTFLHGWFVSQERPGPFHNGATLEHSQMSKILK